MEAPHVLILINNTDELLPDVTPLSNYTLTSLYYLNHVQALSSFHTWQTYLLPMPFQHKNSNLYYTHLAIYAKKMNLITIFDCGGHITLFASHDLENPLLVIILNCICQLKNEISHCIDNLTANLDVSNHIDLYWSYIQFSLPRISLILKTHYLT